MEKNETVRQEGSERGQDKTFPLCSGHTVLRGSVVGEMLEVVGDVIALSPPSLSKIASAG